MPASLSQEAVFTSLPGNVVSMTFPKKKFNYKVSVPYPALRSLYPSSFSTVLRFVLY